MVRHTTARWSGAVLAALLVALAVPTLLSSSWAANENYCPGSPWTCNPSASCADLTWCVDDPGTCVWYAPNYGHRKSLNIKYCTNPDNNASVYCSSCGSDVQSGCCNNLVGEKGCPNVGACP